MYQLGLTLYGVTDTSHLVSPRFEHPICYALRIAEYKRSSTSENPAAWLRIMHNLTDCGTIPQEARIRSHHECREFQAQIPGSFSHNFGYLSLILPFRDLDSVTCALMIVTLPTIALSDTSCGSNPAFGSMLLHSEFVVTFLIQEEYGRCSFLLRCSLSRRHGCSTRRQYGKRSFGG